MATHQSILAWEISWTEKRDGLKSMGSQRVEQDGATEHHARMHSDMNAFNATEFYTQKWSK